MPLLEPNTGFSRLIVSLIAITALCTALCGWGYSLAASKAGEAAHQALEQGVEMHIRSSRLNAVTNQMLLQLFNIQEYTARLLAAFEGARHLKTYKDDSVDRIKAYRAILAKYQPWIDRGFMEDPTFGMQADKNFPDKLKYNWMKPEVLQEQAFARWDACSQRSLTWQALARIFLGILTVLAMAIYLFGQAHGMGEGPWAERLIFYGLLLLLIAVACSLVTLWPGSFQTREAVAEDEKAAQLFAQVHQKLKTARSPQDYRVVVPYLEKLSTELRPNFVKIPFATKTDWTRCLPGGRYRAEIYLNGRLSPHQPAAQNSAGNFACWKLFDLNLALCCPENWQPLSVLTNVKDAPLEVRIDSYLARGLATDKIDGKPAAFFFTFYPSMSGGSTPQEREAEAVKTAKALLTKWKWLDEGAVCNRYDPTRGCDSETPSGEVEYRYWETDEGVQHVGLVLLAAAPLNDLSHTLHSVSNLYRPLKVAGAGP